MMQKNLLKKVAPIVLSAAMLLGMTSVAFAKSSKGVVQNVTIDLDYDLSPGMTASQIDAESDSAGVDSVKVTSITNTDFGKKPKVTLKLKPDSDFTFKGTQKGNVKLNDKGGKGAEVSKIVTSASAMTVTVTLPKTGSTDKDALEVGDVSWGDDDSPVVSWDQADYAKQYEVKLYRNNTIRESVTTNGTSYDFRSQIREGGKGDYTVKVRAVVGNGNGSKGNWTESDEFSVDDDILAALGGKTNNGGSNNGGQTGPNGSNSGNKGAWLKDNVGWWYCNADRSYTTDNWQQIDGNWYYFNKAGYMQTGWLKSRFTGKWYWLSTENGSNLGKMLTNQWVDNNRYYVDNSGIWTQSR